METGKPTLAGRYRLEEIVGRGGMGTVYRATDVVLERIVAVKVLLAALAEEDPTYLARFKREARAAAMLSHPGVVTVYDTGADDGSRFIVMEYVTGRSVASILGDKDPVDSYRAVDITRQVADALAAAHAAGILHRDIKPANVMVTEHGAARVLDFGIARAGDGTSLTHTGSLLGTAAYMAPERALGGGGDERSDIYSLGCVLYALLTGRPPFGGEHPAVILNQQANLEPRPPRELNPDVPAAFEPAVLQMLAKSPDARPQTAGEVRDRLNALAGSPTTPAGLTTMPTAPLHQTTATRVLARPTRYLRGGRAKPAAVALGVLAALVVIVVALTSGGGSQHPARSGTGRSSSTQTQNIRSTITTTSPSPAAVAPPAHGKPKPPGAKAVPPGHGAVPPGHRAVPQGHGGVPPGPAKKHGDGKGGG